MKTIDLNFAGILSKEELHSYLRRRLELPDYYGNNLDALMDCLTDIGEQTTINASGCDDLREKLDKYADSLFRVFENAGEENPNLDISLLDD